MAILWLIIGAIIGAAVAWYYLESNYKTRLTHSSGIGEGDTRLRENEATIRRLEAELAECRAARSAGPGAASDATTAAAVRPAAAAGDDDLTRIKGIGRVLEGKLKGLGIATFRQIAEFDQSDIDRVNAELDFPGRIEREKWVEQARKLSG